MDIERLRILAPSETWHGSNSNAFVRAFRRAGHAVAVVPDEAFSAVGWRNPILRVARRLLNPLIVRDFTEAIKEEIGTLKPHLFFAFKGYRVTPEALNSAKDVGAIAINFWPDTSILDFGEDVKRTLPLYDWVFTTKTFGIDDMRKQANVKNASFMPHGFDVDTHHPWTLADDEGPIFGCEASFIGTWSPKKESLLNNLTLRLPELDLRIWGSQWYKRKSHFKEGVIRNRHILGDNYAKAISGSKINIAILFEGNPHAPSGDKITSRTFHIPASGGFMLHERSNEVGEYFEEDKECVLFSGNEELADKISYYLRNDELRQRIAEAGRTRCLRSGYSIDLKANIIVEKARLLMASRTS